MHYSLIMFKFVFILFLLVDVEILLTEGGHHRVDVHRLHGDDSEVPYKTDIAADLHLPFLGNEHRHREDAVQALYEEDEVALRNDTARAHLLRQKGES